ncbi:MAG: WD40/YVTN/BNR-like repeat-containing protein [Candidatus Dormibacteria bacterium]
MTVIVIALVGVAAAGCGTPSAGAYGPSSPTLLPGATGAFAKPLAPSISLSPAPVGFEPEAVTAVSESEYWVLGTDGVCSGCTPRIWQTTDAGQTFSPIPAPPAQFANPTQGSATSVSDLRFADSVDGWAFGPGLWATHDDGEAWQSAALPGEVIDLEPGAGGYVYSVVDRCVMGGNGPCPVELMRSTTATDRWSAVLSLQDEGQPPPSLGVHGADVWLLGATGLWRSLDFGATFTQLPTPCSAHLGGRIDPVTATAVWAFCPTGNEGGPLVSTDGGQSFRSAYGGEVWSNAAEIAALSSSTAFLTGIGGLDETVDGGASYGVVPAFGGSAAWWLGFTDASVGYAWVADQLPDTTQLQLWRTDDGGAEWTLVNFP